MSDRLEPYVYTDHVRFGDLDAMRHLNNVAFLRFFESARVEFLNDRVTGRDAGDPEHAQLIFAECHIRYRATGRYRDRLRIELWTSELQRSSFRIEFAMRADPGDRLLAEGYGVLVGYDYETGRPAPLTPEIAAAVERSLRG